MRNSKTIIIGIIVLGLVILLAALIYRSKQGLMITLGDTISSSFVCPEDLSGQELVDDEAKFISDYQRLYPGSTIEQMVEYKYKLLVSHSCNETLRNWAQNTDQISSPITPTSTPITFVKCPPGASVVSGNIGGPNMKYYTSVTCDDPVRDQKTPWSDITTIKAYIEGSSTLETGEAILKEIDADVDRDGIKDRLITLNAPEENHCCDLVEVIQGNTTIFSFSGDYPLVGIEPADEGKGFYVLWTSTSQYPGGLCCSTGYIQTQFASRHGVFIPIRERTVSYINLP